MNFLADWHFWLALATAVTAIVAIFMTRSQIKMRNKQHLFDQRMENYVVLRQLYDWYKESEKKFAKYDFSFNSPLPGPINEYLLLTQVPDCLGELHGVVPAKLSKKDEKENRKKIVASCSVLRNAAAKSEVIFKSGEVVKDFILAYSDSTHYLYDYVYFLRNDFEKAIIDTQRIDLWKDPGWEKNLKEQESYVDKSMKRLAEGFRRLNDGKTIDKMIKQIKLK